ncbi:MAG: FHA domain-containing protein [Planctomycetes bacterium]|nr:FHA domain-containing protein [Planctomycetota bacterium]
MELKLVVLAGAKQGTEIPLKKERFVIGRAKECALRAGSEAISRQHCVVQRRDNQWTVRDLGSRNGTFVNDQRIETETPLEAGQELRVGPLRFLVAQLAKAAASEAVQPLEAKAIKQPPVRDVADVAQRTADRSESETTEDDVSSWLLGTSNTSSEAMLKETRALRMEETTSLKHVAAKPGAASAEESTVDQESSPPTANDAAEPSAEQKSGWDWFKLGKGAAKKKVGKLPPRSTDAQSKDSREAATDILRGMTRRH